MRYKIIEAKIGQTVIPVQYIRVSSGKTNNHKVIEIEAGIDATAVSFDQSDVTLTLRLRSA